MTLELEIRKQNTQPHLLYSKHMSCSLAEIGLLILTQALPLVSTFSEPLFQHLVIYRVAVKSCVVPIMFKDCATLHVF